MVKIQKVRWKDRNQAIEILNSYFKQMNQINKQKNYIFKPRAAKQYIDIYYRLQETQRVYFKAMYQDNEILSILMSRVEKNPFLKRENFIFIEFAITKISERKKGYMKNLLEDLERFSIEQKISQLQLKVFSLNQEALDFWKKCNFSKLSFHLMKELKV